MYDNGDGIKLGYCKKNSNTGVIVAIRYISK